MANFDQFDNELLSAYLDDELAPEERARVDERLAVDPEVRRLLEQLRGVSRAMRELPQQSLDSDFRECVLRQADQVTQTSASAAPAVDDVAVTRGDTPGFTIGRSRRAWFWAGLTVAAALLLMVFQSEPERDTGMPRDVALRASGSAADETRGRGSEVPELHVANEPASDFVAAPIEPESVDSFRDAAESSSITSREESPEELVVAPSFGRELSESDGAVASHDARSAPISGGRGEVGRLADSSATDLPARRTTAAASESGDEAVVSDLLVVHMNVTPVAFARKTLDEVLTNHGIVVEPPIEAASNPREENVAGAQVIDVPSDTSGPVANRRSRGLTAGQELEPGQANVDLVLVEAPPAQIYSCLTEVEKDRTNFLDIEVDDEFTADKQVAAKQSAAAEKQLKSAQSYNWKQYNRGQFPEQQRAQLGRDSKLFYDMARAQAEFRSSIADDVAAYGGGGGYSGDLANSPKQQQDFAVSKSQLRNQARAMRIQSQDVLAQSRSEGESIAIQAGTNFDIAADRSSELGSTRGGGASPASESASGPVDDEMLQVLFVLRCAIPTAATDANDESFDESPVSE